MAIKGKFVKSSGSSAPQQQDTYQVKMTAADSPGFLGDKIDNDTIITNSKNTLSVNIQDDKKDKAIWSSTRITKEAIVKAIIFG